MKLPSVGAIVTGVIITLVAMAIINRVPALKNITG